MTEPGELWCGVAREIAKSSQYLGARFEAGISPGWESPSRPRYRRIDTSGFGDYEGGRSRRSDRPVTR